MNAVTKRLTDFPCQNLFLQVYPGCTITQNAIHTPEKRKYKTLAAEEIPNNNLFHGPSQSANLVP